MTKGEPEINHEDIFDISVSCDKELNMRLRQWKGI